MRHSSISPGTRLSDPLDEIVDARLSALDERAATRPARACRSRRPLSETQLRRADAARRPPAKQRRPQSPRAPGCDSGHATGIGIAHVLLAEAIEASLLPAERHALHSRSLAASFDEHWPPRLAWHLVRAGHVAEAREHILPRGSEVRQPIDPGGTTLGHLSRHSS